MKTKLFFTLAIMFVVSFCTSCKKDWLEKKRDLSVIVPATLNDLRLILNADFPLNYDTRGITEVSCDDIYTTQAQYDAISRQLEKNALIWKKDIFESAPEVNEWDIAYQQVLYSNVVLDGLNKIARTNANALEYDDIKGTALFWRSKAFLNLVMTFSRYYEESSAQTDPGIPLKLSADINEAITRSSVQKCYDQITSDLNSAAALLPNATLLKTNASKVTAYSLLARCYLFMDNYKEALKFANLSYSLHNVLLDFNTLNSAASRPIPTLSEETHIYSNISRAYTTQSTGSSIDEELYQSYEENDLRKVMFFLKQANGTVRYRGSYSGGSALYGGTATDEILLIIAECKARQNDVPGSMDALNALLTKRYKTGFFSPRSASDAESALKIVLQERRKELLRRGLRWQDLKRLNRDPRFAKTLSKNLNGQVYTLPPNDPRYIMPVPDYIIQRTGITQNLR